jgi:antitoxin (DNA-binding transcriptional repressor) of toxin-antitoxin stability system
MLTATYTRPKTHLSRLLDRPAKGELIVIAKGWGHYSDSLLN